MAVARATHAVIAQNDLAAGLRLLQRVAKSLRGRAHTLSEYGALCWGQLVSACVP